MEFDSADIYLYLGEFMNCLHSIRVTDLRGKSFNLPEGVKKGVQLISSVKDRGKKLMFVGNGASAAISSHQATDFIRSCKIRTWVPLDHSLLTCMVNDRGYENMFSEPLGLMADYGDVLFAISSSGRSKNVVNAVKAAHKAGSKVITLSGFKGKNPLRQLGDINFYVPSDSYRFVESVHLFICNWLLDFTIKNLQKKK